MNPISIEFHGAAKTVTGSKHLLKTPEGNILIDCGLFQGIKDVRIKNWQPFTFRVEDVKYMLLTHSHLDHCGAIPLLIKNGYKGEIFCTAPTKDLSVLILLDSAKIQEDDAYLANINKYTKHEPAIPLYTIKDVENSLSLFKTCEEDQWIILSDNIKFRFQKNGHILGSCFIEIHCYEKKIVFSGDIGRYNSSILESPKQLKEADYLILESTYGNKLHDNIPAEEILADTINETIHKKGNLIISSFAVGRAQELIYLIYQLKKHNKIPRIPIYLDTPMGITATDIFMRYPHWHKLSSKVCKDMMDDITIVKEYWETETVISTPGIKIIIAASGMLTGGRVLSYLKEFIGNRKNTILLGGYQAEGTRGRALKEGVHEIKIDGKYFSVKAEIREIPSLSAHADQKEMLQWLNGFTKKPETIFLIHGEPMALDAFRIKLRGETPAEIIIPSEDDYYQLF